MLPMLCETPQEQNGADVVFKLMREEAQKKHEWWAWSSGVGPKIKGKTNRLGDVVLWCDLSTISRKHIIKNIANEGRGLGEYESSEPNPCQIKMHLLSW